MPVIPTPKQVHSTAGDLLNHSEVFDFIFDKDVRVVKEVIFFNKDTQTGYKYQIETRVNSEGQKVCFISVECDELVRGYLRGVANYSNYAFIGTVFGEKHFSYSEKSKVDKEDLAVKGFDVIFKMMYTNAIPSQLEIFDTAQGNHLKKNVTSASSDLRYRKLLHSKNRRAFWGVS